MNRSFSLAAIAAFATLVAAPAFADCGTFVQHSTEAGCRYLQLSGANRPFVISGKIPAQGACPARNKSGNLEYRVTRATPQPLAGGWCGMKGWKDFNPSTKATRPGTIG